MNYWHTLLSAEVIGAMVLATGILPVIILGAAILEQKLQLAPISHEIWVYIGLSWQPMAIYGSRSVLTFWAADEKSRENNLYRHAERKKNQARQ